MTNMEPNKGEIVMYQPDETIRLEVRMDGETVWLSQAQMAELFKSSRTNVVEHIQHIYEDEELVENLTCRKFRQVRQEGKRMVEREIPMYNLDMIISVGYRVNSKRGVKFRQWATRKLKDYLLKGYVVNSRIIALEEHVAKQDTQIQGLKDKIDFFVRSSLPPVEGIFYDGQIFDAYAHIISLIKQAKHSIVLIDNYIDENTLVMNYIDENTLVMLSKRNASVSATIYTRQLSQQQQLDLQRHNQQYPSITVNVCQHNHDRFLIIDDAVYIFGASLKDAGKKLFAYIRMQETSATELLNNIR